ncbi:unnamed protein product [Symbiodinium sp. CCMP2592]|nr:unnamed protein product [Symbiodinium sp. CCMP2592]
MAGGSTILELKHHVLNGRLAQAKKLIAASQISLEDVADEDGNTPLHWLAHALQATPEATDQEMLTFLLQNAAPKNRQNSLGETPLMSAVRNFLLDEKRAQVLIEDLLTKAHVDPGRCDLVFDEQAEACGEGTNIGHYEVTNIPVLRHGACLLDRAIQNYHIEFRNRSRRACLLDRTIQNYHIELRKQIRDQTSIRTLSDLQSRTKPGKLNKNSHHITNLLPYRIKLPDSEWPKALPRPTWLSMTPGMKTAISPQRRLATDLYHYLNNLTNNNNHRELYYILTTTTIYLNNRWSSSHRNTTEDLRHNRYNVPRNHNHNKQMQMKSNRHDAGSDRDPALDLHYGSSAQAPAKDAPEETAEAMQPPTLTSSATPPASPSARSSNPTTKTDREDYMGSHDPRATSDDNHDKAIARGSKAKERRQPVLRKFSDSNKLQLKLDGVKNYPIYLDDNRPDSLHSDTTDYLDKIHNNAPRDATTAPARDPALTLQLGKPWAKQPRQTTSWHKIDDDTNRAMDRDDKDRARFFPDNHFGLSGKDKTDSGPADRASMETSYWEAFLKSHQSTPRDRQHLRNDEILQDSQEERGPHRPNRRHSRETVNDNLYIHNLNTEKIRLHGQGFLDKTHGPHNHCHNIDLTPLPQDVTMHHDDPGMIQNLSTTTPEPLLLRIHTYYLLPPGRNKSWPTCRIFYMLYYNKASYNRERTSPRWPTKPVPEYMNYKGHRLLTESWAALCWQTSYRIQDIIQQMRKDLKSGDGPHQAAALDALAGTKNAASQAVFLDLAIEERGLATILDAINALLATVDRTAVYYDRYLDFKDNLNDLGEIPACVPKDKRTPRHTKVLPFLVQAEAALVAEAHGLLFSWTTSIWGHPIYLVDGGTENNESPDTATMPGGAPQGPTEETGSPSDAPTQIFRSRSPRPRERPMPLARASSHRRRRMHAAFYGTPEGDDEQEEEDS